MVNIPGNSPVDIPFNIPSDKPIAVPRKTSSYIDVVRELSALLWFDANFGVYSDTGLTTPADNNGAVGGWADQSGNGHHVTQASGTEQPIYKSNLAALNNKPAVQFVSNDYLSRNLSGSIISNLNLWNAYVVIANSASLTGYVWAESNNTTATPLSGTRVLGGAGTAGHVHRDNAGNIEVCESGNIAINDGAAKLITVRRTAANAWNIRVNGVSRDSGTTNAGATTITRLALGALITTSVGSYYAGHTAQVILVPSDSYAVVEPALAQFYGITLP